MMFLYSLTEPARVLICMISVFCVGFQTAAFVYTVVRSTFRDRKRTAAYISQTAVTAQSLVMLIIVARAQLNAWMFLPAGSEYEVMRYGVFAAVAASCIAVACVGRVYDVLLCAVVSSVSLPYIDLLPYKAAAVIFCAAELLLIARALLLMRVCRRDIKNELSRDSVKLALDELHSGLLFCEPDGNILLVNGRMQRLMQVLCGEVYRDGKKFYERLLSGDVSDSCSSNVIDGKTVFILPDGKVWFFTRCDIYIKNRRYVQLSAADVTEQWMLTNELNAQRAMLQSRGLELKEMISEVRFLCREEEMLRIRSRFHDILGQRLALLFRSLREGEEPDEELIRRFAYNLPEELSGREAVTTAADRLETLCRLMQEIGVTLIIDGNLPEKESLAWLGMDIITEAVTNSVRHGLASEVYISLGQSGGNFSMRITDNGIPPKSELVEGGGLSSIRRKVGLFDGSVKVETKPRFVLSVFIPGGETL